MAGEGNELIIEFVPIRNSVKVTVFDPVTLTEVSILGPASAARSDLEQAAVQKLYYMLDTKKAAKARAAAHPDKKGGIIV